MRSGSLSRATGLLRAALANHPRTAAVGLGAGIGSLWLLGGCMPAEAFQGSPVYTESVPPKRIARGFVPREPAPPGISQIPADGDGALLETYHAGLEGENYIIVELGGDANAGSDAASIQFKVGTSFTITLLNGGNFVPNAALRYDLGQNCRECYKAIPPDDWDSLRLEISSGDGVQIHRLLLVKSSEKLLDETPDAWLDRYYQRVLDFSIAASSRKWGDVSNTRVTDLYYAAQDLGQTGAQKYVNQDTAWCSEFAAYMIRKNGLPNVPAGSIGTADLKRFFTDTGRIYYAEEVEGGAYSVRAGDYMSLWQTSDDPSGRHSVLFRGWKGGTPVPGAFSPDQEFYTIEGNVGNSVRTTTRKWSDVYFVGNTR
jgi:hypothetical protein